MTARLISRKDPVHLSYVSLEDAIKALQDAREKHGKDARLAIELEYEYGHETISVYVEYRSPETLAERAEREAREKQIEDGQRRYYEQLKKRFEK